MITLEEITSILNSHASPTPSRWREKAEYRRNNRDEIRKQQLEQIETMEREIKFRGNIHDNPELLKNK